MGNETYVQGHENNGGGNKSATLRQLVKIEKLARKHNKSGMLIVKEVYNKHLTEITGNEAHCLIQLLQKQLE